MYKIFHWHAKLIANDLSIDKAFESMHQSVMTKIKILLVKVRLLKQLWSMVLRLLIVSIDGNSSREKWTQ